LAAAYILRWWSVKHSDFFNQRFARWLTITGQFSLPVFATSSLLSFIAFVIIQEINSAIIPTLIINIIGCLLLIGLAHILHKRKQVINYRNYPAVAPIDTN
jgi:glycopeptide antibiotics resistance protein